MTYVSATASGISIHRLRHTSGYHGDDVLGAKRIRIVALVVPAPKMSRVRRLWVERPAEVSSNKPDFGMLTS